MATSPMLTPVYRHLWKCLEMLNETTKLSDELFKDVKGLKNSLKLVFRAVYDHDPNGCPVTVAHAVVELARLYSSACFPAVECLMSDMYLLYTMHNFDAKRAPLKRLQDSSRTNTFLPRLMDAEPYLLTIEQYLEFSGRSL